MEQYVDLDPKSAVRETIAILRQPSSIHHRGAKQTWEQAFQPEQTMKLRRPKADSSRRRQTATPSRPNSSPNKKARAQAPCGAPTRPSRQDVIRNWSGLAQCASSLASRASTENGRRKLTGRRRRAGLNWTSTWKEALRMSARIAPLSKDTEGGPNHQIAPYVLYFCNICNRKQFIGRQCCSC